jgi:hypothetical protein
MISIKNIKIYVFFIIIIITKMTGLALKVNLRKKQFFKNNFKSLLMVLRFDSNTIVTSS